MCHCSIFIIITMSFSCCIVLNPILLSTCYSFWAHIFFFPFFPLVQLQSQQSSFVKKVTIIAPLPPIRVYAIYRMSKRDHIWIFLHHISVSIFQTIDNTTIRITVILIRMSTSSIRTIQIRMITKMRKRKPSGRALQKSEVHRQARIELRSSFWVRLGRHSSWLLLSFYHHFLCFIDFRPCSKFQ